MQTMIFHYARENKENLQILNPNLCSMDIPTTEPVSCWTHIQHTSRKHHGAWTHVQDTCRKHHGAFSGQRRVQHTCRMRVSCVILRILRESMCRVHLGVIVSVQRSSLLTNLQ